MRISIYSGNVTVLGQMAGVGTGNYSESQFSDVEDGLWYSSYVTLAADNGIVNGDGGPRPWL